MIPLIALIFVLLFGIEELVVQLEKSFSIFPMQGFCNKIYGNYHKTIGWDLNDCKEKCREGNGSDGRCERCW